MGEKLNSYENITTKPKENTAKPNVKKEVLNDLVVKNVAQWVLKNQKNILRIFWWEGRGMQNIQQDKIKSLGKLDNGKTLYFVPFEIFLYNSGDKAKNAWAFVDEDWMPQDIKYSAWENLTTGRQIWKDMLMNEYFLSAPIHQLKAVLIKDMLTNQDLWKNYFKAKNINFDQKYFKNNYKKIYQKLSKIELNDLANFMWNENNSWKNIIKILDKYELDKIK